MKKGRLFSVVAILLIVATFLTLGLAGCKSEEEVGDKIPNLEIIKDTGKDLLNTYSMIAVGDHEAFATHSKPNKEGADAFIKWMSLKTTRNLIADYGKADFNAALFYLNDDAKVLEIEADTLKYDASVHKAKNVRLSTTTSVNDTGLLPFLQPNFEKLGWKLEVQSAGTGAAIQAAKDGNADLILVHSKNAEEEFIDAGYSRKVEGFENDRISFMHNFFVLVGPKDDPAKAKDAADVKAAFAAIAKTESKFISRGDKSGTYNKEVSLWGAETGLNFKEPDEQRKYDWYMSIGQGMGTALTTANEEKAYTLTDIGTYLRYKNNKVD